MPIITLIEEQKKYSKRVNIYIDNNFFTGTFKEVIEIIGLEEGMEVNPSNLNEIIEKEALVKIKEKAFKILDRSNQSEQNLRVKLQKHGFDTVLCSKTIEWLKEEGFLNDEQYARSIARDKSRINKFGTSRVKYFLKHKQVDEHVIEKIIPEEVSPEIEMINAKELAVRKFDKLNQISKYDKRQIYSKLCNYLASRGYNYSIIKEVLKEVLKA